MCKLLEKILEGENPDMVNLVNNFKGYPIIIENNIKNRQYYSKETDTIEKYGKKYIYLESWYFNKIKYIEFLDYNFIKIESSSNVMNVRI